jgi:hypothetical protein
MKQTLKLLTISLCALTVLAISKAPAVHAADTNFADGITVDSKLDTTDLTLGDGNCDDGSGNCTLRAAIEESNNNADATVIKFNLTGPADYTVNGQSGHTISPSAPLPTLDETVTIDGYTQPGSEVNTNSIGQPFNATVLVHIDGSVMTGGLSVGLYVKSNNTIIRGVSVTRVLGGILIEEVSNAVVEGSLVGIRPDGAALGNRQAGVLMVDTNNTRVGGPNSGSRNVLAYNDTDGAGAGSSVATQPSGFSTANNNLVVQGNYIGTGLDGKVDSANKSKNAGGIVLQGAGDTSLIGGSQPSEANIIAGNVGFGVGILSYTLSGFGAGIMPQRNAIIGNRIYDSMPRDLTPNGPNLPGIGIDLAQMDDSSNPPDGPDSFINIGLTLNDPGDSDTGPNNYMNFPTLNSVTQQNDTVTVNFNLDSADSPVGQYRVELFANDVIDETGYGEGQSFLGALTVSNANNQQGTLQLPAGSSIVGKSISATTTAVDPTTQSGFGATSEFAKNVTALDSKASTLATTGANVGLLMIVATCIMCITGVIIVQIRLSKS